MEQKAVVTMRWRTDGPNLEERIALWRYHDQQALLRSVPEGGESVDSLRQLSENLQRTSTEPAGGK